MLVALLSVTLYSLSCGLQSPAAPRSVTVAVYEHNYVSGSAKNREEALDIMWRNVHVLEAQMKAAAAKGAKVFVFPEYGLTGSMYTTAKSMRTSVYDYMQIVPQPNSQQSCMGCSSTVVGSEVVQTVGCLANTYDMYVVANLIENVTCSNNSSDCPKDGHFQYNTNIVFNRTGCLVAKYHKHAPFMEEKQRLDFPRKAEHVFFDTEFGRFGTEICFDLMFSEPGTTLVEKYHVDTVLFPTDWPLLHSDIAIVSNVIQYSSGWARAHGVNLLAANIHGITENITGSAITTPDGIKAAYYNQTSNKGQLLLADIPIKTHTKKKSVKRLEAEPILKQLYSKADNFSSYSSVPLGGTEGRLRVCHEHICCHLDYARNGHEDEIYQFAAYAGRPLSILPYNVEMCLLRRCSSLYFESCFDPNESQAESMFTKLVIKGTFKEKFVYPTVSGAGPTYVGMDFKYNYDNSVHQLVETNFTAPLLTAALVSWQPGTN